MFKKFAPLTIALLILLSGLLAFADTGITVMYNNKLMAVSPSPMIINGRTLVPLRSIMENFGATVEWQPADQSIAIKLGETSIALKINNLNASINSQSLTLDVAPRLIGDRTFVPLRFVSEALHKLVRWDSKSQTVNIIDYLSTSFIDLPLGSTHSEALSILGDPTRTDQSLYGFNWLIYNNTPAAYRQVGIKNGKVVATYSFDIAGATGGLLDPVMNSADVRGILGPQLSRITKGTTSYAISGAYSETFKAGQTYYTCYYDTSPQKRIYAVLVIDATVEESFKGFYGTPSKTFLSSLELESFDITNAFRVRSGLKPLKASTALSTTARNHSLDMSLRQYFNHTSPDGKTLKDRILTAFSSFANIGENIAMGASDSSKTFDLWVHSPGHLSIILGDYDSMGAGSAFGSDSAPYYTQHYIKSGILK